MKRFLILLATLLFTMGSVTVNAQTIADGIYRVKSKRTGYYMSTAAKGAATTTVQNLNAYDQIWVIRASGTGYTLRSANTGEYLQADYAVPASQTSTLYIRKSPNATGSENFYNISSKDDFSGKFLNTNTSSYKLISYDNMDAGCDWYLETVANFTVEAIQARIRSMLPYAGELEDGAYYRITSYYDLVATGGDYIVTKKQNDENLYQFWQLKKSGSGWLIQDVVSQKYIQRQTSTSATYSEGSTQVAFNIKPVNDSWDYRWTISYGSDTQGLHDAQSQSHNVVLWNTNAGASEWHFEKVNLSEEDIEKARTSLATYNNLVNNRGAISKWLAQLFEDKSCTTLNSQIQEMTDENLAANRFFKGLNEDLQQMVLKVKNDTWKKYRDNTTDYEADYEKFFRVADYHVYSNYQNMRDGNNFTMSYPFGRLSNPTGIVANAGDILYIFVGEGLKDGSELMLEAVSTDGVSGSHPTGEQLALGTGLNLFRFTEKKMLYIFYQTTYTDGTIEKKLADFPDIKIHIEGGQLNGYWDATRGMTNADWKLLQQDLLKAPYVNLKTEHLVFQMDTPLVLAAEPNEMEGLMHIWDRICANEQRYMGVEDFEGKYNNIWNVFSGASSYMHATNYGTWYSEGTIPTVMNYNKMSNGGGNLWGPSHEIGHCHQASINVIGTTESSNNLFSNINTFESGILNSRRYYPSSNFEYITSGTPWLQRNIWMTTSMFFQLYLYFHVQHHDDNFLPNLFRKMRKNPINKWSGPANGGPTSYGKDDYLHLAKMICDVAQADLSEFFEAYGMFIPVDMCEVGDYSTYFVTTTQKDIDEAKAYMQKYEKKLGNIMFIDDRVIQKKADADNIFGCVPASDGFKRANEEYPYLMKSASASYVGGDYESFTKDAEAVMDDYYRLNTTGKVITFYGTKNYAGHKFYDAAGNLIWATNKARETLPQKVLDFGINNVTIVTANYDMTDTPCTTEKPVIALTGDLNGDNAISIADVTALVNVILGKNEAPVRNDKNIADVNGDGNVTIADVTALVNIILGK